MSHKNMTIQDAIEYIKNANTYDDFAFRGDNYTPAKKFRNSWYHPSDVDDGKSYNLGGVSAIKVMVNDAESITEAANAARRYGCNLFLLQGYSINADEENNDPGECLMTEHKIVAIIK